MFNLLSILAFLLLLKPKEAGGPPITVMGVARSFFVVCGMIAKKIRNSFTIRGEFMLHQLHLASTTLVEVMQSGPLSQSPLATVFLSLMPARVFIHVGT